MSIVVKRCAICARFGAYEAEDRFCLTCGHESLEDACACGRRFEYALSVQDDSLFCPRCGRRLRGRSDEYSA